MLELGLSNLIHPSWIHGENVTIGNFCIIEENVIIGNNVKIRNYVLLKKGIKIGDNVIIDSMTYVTKDCLEEGFYFGNPARFFKEYLEE
jgi:UDP-N-acetylglucosamine acyltransferase